MVIYLKNAQIRQLVFFFSVHIYDKNIVIVNTSQVTGVHYIVPSIGEMHSDVVYIPGL